MLSTIATCPWNVACEEHEYEADKPPALRIPPLLQLSLRPRNKLGAPQFVDEFEPVELSSGPTGIPGLSVGKSVKH